MAAAGDFCSSPPGPCPGKPRSSSAALTRNCGFLCWGAVLMSPMSVYKKLDGWFVQMSHESDSSVHSSLLGVAFVPIVLVLVAVVFLVLLFFILLFSNEQIGGYRTISGA